MAVGSGSGGSSSDIKAGGAFITLFTKDEMLRKGLDGAAKRLSQFGTTLSGIGNKSMLGGAALAAPMIAFFKGGVDRAAEMDDLADAFGTTVESLSPLAHAFGVAGLGLDELDKALKKAAETGGAGKVEDKLKQLIEFGEGIQDPMERAAFYFDKFGKSGSKVAAIAVQLDTLMQDAPLMTSESAANAEKTQMAFNAMKLSIQGALLPGINWLAQYAQMLSLAVQRTPELAQAIVGIGAAAIGAGIALKVLGTAFSTVSIAMGLLSAGVGVIGFLLSPIGAVTAAIGGLAAVWLTSTTSGKDAVNSIGGFFSEIADTGATTWSGMMAAFQAGDLQEAFEFAARGLRIMWLETVDFLTNKWKEFKKGVAEGFPETRKEIGEAIMKKMNEAFEDPKTKRDLGPPKEQFRIGDTPVRARLTWNGRPLDEALGLDHVQTVREVSGGMRADRVAEMAAESLALSAMRLTSGIENLGMPSEIVPETEIQQLKRLQREALEAIRNRGVLVGSIGRGAGDAAAGAIEMLAGPMPRLVEVMEDLPKDIGEQINQTSKGMFSDMAHDISMSLGAADQTNWDEKQLKEMSQVKENILKVGDKIVKAVEKAAGWKKID